MVTELNETELKKYASLQSILYWVRMRKDTNETRELIIVFSGRNA